MASQADRIAAALRPIAPRGKLVGTPSTGEIGLINALAALWEKRLLADPAGGPGVAVPDPAWIVIGRKLIGEREIPGPKSNALIAKGWSLLGAPWFNDDATPWCGWFVAHCLDAAGLPYPTKGEFARALRWTTWGTAVTPRLGAIGVKTRNGGGHVFFIVGETPDGRSFKVLEGNANDMIRIGDIPKAAVIATRWPQGAPIVNIPLPVMPAGTIARSEA